jgi:hypothetical protein
MPNRLGFTADRLGKRLAVPQSAPRQPPPAAVDGRWLAAAADGTGGFARLATTDSKVRSIRLQPSPLGKSHPFEIASQKPNNHLTYMRLSAGPTGVRTRPCPSEMPSADVLAIYIATMRLTSAPPTAGRRRWPRIYKMLKAAGHDPAEAAGILLAAERKGDRALALIKTVRASTTTTFDF